jgi:AcrR family transcriptional regulator
MIRTGRPVLMLASDFKSVNLENKSVRKILRAAQDLWTRDGYHGASLQEIAAAAGVAKSLVHYHFESKEHLLIELSADWSHRVSRGIRKRLVETPPSPAAAFAALDQIWDALVLTRAQFPFAIELWRQSVTSASVRERLRAFDRELLSLYIEGLHTTLGPLADRLAIPPERAAALIQALFDGLGLRLFLEDDVAAVRRTFDDAKHLLVKALLPAGEKGSRS